MIAKDAAKQPFGEAVTIDVGMVEESIARFVRRQNGLVSRFFACRSELKRFTLLNDTQATVSQTACDEAARSNRGGIHSSAISAPR